MDNPLNQRELYLDTPCKDCVFAKYEDDIQTECTLGRIDKFRDNGNTILEAYDESKAFYVIKDRVCNAYREAEWSEKYEGTNLEDQVLFEVWQRTKFTIVINLDKNGNMDLLQYTLRSIEAQSILPYEVIILNRSPHKFFTIKEYLKEYAGKFKWIVIDVKDKNESFNRTLDMLVGKVTGIYYALFNGGYYIPSTFVSDINNFLNKEMKAFVLAKPTADGNGLIVSRILHKMMGSSPHGHSLVEFVEKLAAEQCLQKQIVEVTDICKTIH